MNPLSSTFDKIAETNVRGVLSMQKRDYAIALSNFHDGLSILLEEHPTPHPHHTHKRAPLDQEMVVSIPLPDDNHSSLQDEVFGLFNRALHIRMDVDEVRGNEELYSHLLTAVLTYNVGLSHQLVGLQRGQSRVLDRSLEFYSMVYSSLTTENAMTSWQNEEEEEQKNMNSLPICLEFFLLALANNIGHIHATFRRFAETAICKDEMTYRLCNALKNTTTTASRGCEDEEENSGSNNNNNESENGIDSVEVTGDYKIFLLNISLFNLHDFVSAPAA